MLPAWKEEPVLHAASFMGSTSAVRVLLELGANPNVINKVNMGIMVATTRYTYFLSGIVFLK